MEEYRVIEWSDGFGAYLMTARRLTEEEKKSYAQWVWDRGFRGLGTHIQLRYIRWYECPRREDDGFFAGGGGNGNVWILTPEEWDGYVALNAEREQAKKDAEAREYAEWEAAQAAYEAKKAERVSKLDSWTTEDLLTMDEDGQTHTYMHTLTMHGKTYTFKERNLFDFGRVINPAYPVAPVREPGGISTIVDGVRGWEDFVDGEGWRFIRPMEPEEEYCFRIVLDYGKYVGFGVRM